MIDTQQAEIERVYNLNTDRFDKHRILSEGENRWYCGKPDTSINSFRVIAFPGGILVTGDLYELVLIPRSRNVVGWLASVTKKPCYVDYPLEKMHASRDGSSGKVWCEDFAMKVIEAEIEFQKKNGGFDEFKLWMDFKRNFRDSGYQCEHEWFMAWEEAGGDGSDPPSGRKWSNQVLMPWFALCWWCQNLHRLVCDECESHECVCDECYQCGAGKNNPDCDCDCAPAYMFQSVEEAKLLSETKAKAKLILDAAKAETVKEQK